MSLRRPRGLDAANRFDHAAGTDQPQQSNDGRPPAPALDAAPRSWLRLRPRARSTASRAAASGAIALFDLDGTITRRDTYLAYLVGFLARHPERWSRAALLPVAVLCHLAGWRDNTWLKTTFLRAVLGGVPQSRLQSWTESFLDRVLRDGLRTGALQAIARHRAAGHRLVLVTASLDFYAEPLGRRLGFDAVLCTRAAYDAEGRVTGALEGPNLYGAEKLAGVQRHVRRHVPDTPVICYCDHHSDLPLLQFADQPIAINPTRRLRRTAKRIGLPIEHWS